MVFRDPALLEWLSDLDPETELVARLAIRGLGQRFRGGSEWGQRIDQLMAQLELDEDRLAGILARAAKMGEKLARDATPPGTGGRARSARGRSRRRR
ncbi:MAG: hypothetical protein ACLQJR_05700 [Stellaceae bacterium]